MKYELDLPEATPSLNRMQRRHWSHGYKLKRRWNKMVWVCARMAYPTGVTPIPHAKVTVTRYAPQPIQDLDNLYASFKPLGDALSANGLIVDDSMEDIELTMKQGKWLPGGIPHTHVLIEAPV